MIVLGATLGTAGSYCFDKMQHAKAAEIDSVAERKVNDPVPAKKAQEIPPKAGKHDVRKGDAAAVRREIWVSVKNEHVIRNSQRPFEYDDHCRLQKGGQIRAIGVDGQHVLAEYANSLAARGTYCPAGTILFLSKRVFNDMATRHERSVRERRAEQEKIAGMIRR